MKSLVGQILDFAFFLVMVLAISSTIMTWIPQLRWTQVGRIIYSITEPVYMKFRKIFPPLMIKRGVAMDFSALGAFFTFYLVYVILKKYLVPFIP